jgi:hypothetical protein
MKGYELLFRLQGLILQSIIYFFCQNIYYHNILAHFIKFINFVLIMNVTFVYTIAYLIGNNIYINGSVFFSIISSYLLILIASIFVVLKINFHFLLKVVYSLTSISKIYFTMFYTFNRIFWKYFSNLSLDVNFSFFPLINLDVNLFGN